MKEASDEPLKKPDHSISVGEEFMLWAEQHWGIKNQLGKTSEAVEAAPYDYVRQVFVKKVNEIINKRLNLYE